MAIVTDITKLSQTASLNGPDGSVDPPSSLDDQDRYLGSFIAMLRDGIGFTAGAPVVALGFTPVQQGGLSTGTKTNQVSIGYNPTLGKIVCAIDTNQFANKWPIDISGDAASTGGQVFSWANSSNQPTYVWGANANGAAFLAAPAGMNVASANNAAACSGNAATATTASNANAVNGISGWTYTNSGANPAYIWCTDGAGTYQHLTQPGNLSVNYANSCNSANYATSAGSAPANGGTASNSNALGGQGPAYYVNNGGSRVDHLRDALPNIIIGLSGSEYWWNVNALSDIRLKTGIMAAQVDSLANIMRMRFVAYRFKNTDVKIDDGQLHRVGVIADDAEKIESEWVGNHGTWKQLNTDAMLMSAMHSIQQLGAKVAKLSQLITGGS